ASARERLEYMDLLTAEAGASPTPIAASPTRR
ncbi:MAG: hypothetical protein JWM53_1932, partial [bacterium]|nr:hypothetical protein [bacterium]